MSGDDNISKGESTSGDQSDVTANVGPNIADLLKKYNKCLEAGEDVDIDALCRDYEGPQEEARKILLAMQAAESQLRAVTPKSVPGPNWKEDIDGSSLTSATRFTRLRMHAQGGLGIVFKAFDEDLGREVAVKILAEAQNPFYEESCTRFLRESEVMGRLRHPGIIPVLTRGETLDGRPFYVMPFLEEGSLEKAINQFHEDFPTYRPREAQFRDLLTRYMSACKTVAYAHSRGVVHRDLKPHNIMLGRYGETLVIDWGLAERSDRKDEHRLTGEQSIVLRNASSSSTSGGFTPQYASPEQFDGNLPIGPPSDIYSLGAILYKLVTGVPPLTATTLGEIRQAGLRGEFPPPRDRNRSVPKPLQAICLKALHKDPAQRYESAELLALDVEAYIADATVSAFEEDFVGRSARLVRQHWPVVLAGMAALLMISLISFFAAYTQSGLKENAHESSISRLQLATTLAAQKCGAEIDRRWRLLELEAASPSLIAAVEKLNSDKADNEARRDLQAQLTERYVFSHHVHGIKFESMFINGVDGDQQARVPKSDSITQNFAYRHYFHGQGMDLPKGTSNLPATFPVLSVVYISTNTQKPHVALSVPIWGSADEKGNRSVVGRLDMSISVGDLGMFDHLGGEEVPMLVESRKYNWGDTQSYGLVVHHPDFYENQPEGSETPDSLPRVSNETVDTLIRSWKRHNTLSGEQSALIYSDFVEPMHSQKIEAAFSRVVVPGREQEVRETGWFIVMHPRKTEE
ncbi:MAG: serine/threonine protein kinase [Planctomycetaceae bacterium]|nr:serine/threonine protein kinase [Planctomycetaceae bacterium]